MIESNRQSVNKITTELITGLILAGGAGSRLEGQDKGMVIYQGERLIDTQVRRLQSSVNETIISANRNIEEYRKFNCPVVEDRPLFESEQSEDSQKELYFEEPCFEGPCFEGPLFGLLACLKASKNEYVFVNPVDVPNLPNDMLLNWLEKINNLPQDKKRSCYYLKTNQRDHFLSLLIHVENTQLLQNYLEKGERRVGSFLHSIDSLGMDIGIEEESFKNLNKITDF